MRPVPLPRRRLQDRHAWHHRPWVTTGCPTGASSRASSKAWVRPRMRLRLRASSARPRQVLCNVTSLCRPCSTGDPDVYGLPGALRGRPGGPGSVHRAVVDLCVVPSQHPPLVLSGGAPVRVKGAAVLRTRWVYAQPRRRCCPFPQSTYSGRVLRARGRHRRRAQWSGAEGWDGGGQCGCGQQCAFARPGGELRGGRRVMRALHCVSNSERGLLP